MYFIINNAFNITSCIRRITPNNYNEDQNVASSVVRRLASFIERTSGRRYHVTNVSNMIVLDLSESDNNKKYYLTSNGNVRRNVIECYLVMCLQGSCNVTVNTRNTSLSNNVTAFKGFVIGSKHKHFISSNNALLFITKCELLRIAVITKPVSPKKKQYAKRNNCLSYNVFNDSIALTTLNAYSKAIASVLSTILMCLIYNLPYKK